MELFTAQQIQSLNELELLVYRYINEHPNTVPFMRIRELAAEAHVSTTTVLHFCKKMGCDGYAQFKWKLKEHAGQNGRHDPAVLHHCPPGGQREKGTQKQLIPEPKGETTCFLKTFCGAAQWLPISWKAAGMPMAAARPSAT